MLSVFFMADFFSYSGSGLGLTLGLSFWAASYFFPLAEIILWFILGLGWVQVQV